MEDKKNLLIIGLIILALIIPYSVLAAPKLIWDAPVEGGAVNAYRVYWRTSGGTYSETNKYDSGTTECLFSVLPLQEKITYSFIVRAVNEAGESGDSNEESWTVPDETAPGPVQGVSVE
ncbi:MAG: fibronectin type III domain-containing protein [Deltaproteobacteria bacterium]|nr:fibronectin type III domain-containing protein [Deltaproteobacteria bacterium]MBW1860926.1 fibronectin type III domain-containing protein [Deltaproteobacteria bacterium]